MTNDRKVSDETDFVESTEASDNNDDRKVSNSTTGSDRTTDTDRTMDSEDRTTDSDRTTEIDCADTLKDIESEIFGFEASYRLCQETISQVGQLRIIESALYRSVVYVLLYTV